jgi:NTP pyrophosphatase (non-canonical NTP hydrolase)
MKPQYEPKTVDQALGYLVEECGEVLAAVGKTQRWGLASVNPDLPVEKQETNRDWILRELEDLSGAIDRARTFLTRTFI